MTITAVEHLLSIIDCRLQVITLYHSCGLLKGAPDYGELVGGVEVLLSKFEKQITHPVLAGVADNTLYIRFSPSFSL